MRYWQYVCFFNLIFNLVTIYKITKITNLQKYDITEITRQKRKLQISNPFAFDSNSLRFFLWQLNLTQGRKRKAKARSCRGTTFGKEVRKRADAPLTNVKVGRGAPSLIVSNLGGLRSPAVKLGCSWSKLSRSPVTKGPTVALSR